MYSLILLFLGITIWSYSQLGICGPPPIKYLSETFFRRFFHILQMKKSTKKSFRQIFYADTFFFGPVPSKDIQIPLPSEVKDLHLHER